MLTLETGSSVDSLVVGVEEWAQYAKGRAGGIRERTDARTHGLVGVEQRESSGGITTWGCSRKKSTAN